MALVVDDGVLTTPAELVLGSKRMPIDCRITVEWLRGVSEPTWYGVFTLRDDLRMLPGAYHLHVAGTDHRILLRRQTKLGPEAVIPFWGLGHPPDVPRASHC